MEKILRFSDEQVLVYVALTKARVKRIAAEIQSRFAKSYTQKRGSLWAIHTRDIRVNDATKCRILVTVPNILHIMLLTPMHASSWFKSVKTVVFDDMHCVDETKDCVVWEQLFLLVTCPIISLSTVSSNIESFGDRLRRSEERKGRDLIVIRQGPAERDVRHFIYVTSEQETFSGLREPSDTLSVSLDDAGRFEFLHPIACLSHRYVPWFFLHLQRT